MWYSPISYISNRYIHHQSLFKYTHTYTSSNFFLLSFYFVLSGSNFAFTKLNSFASSNFTCNLLLDFDFSIDCRVFNNWFIFVSIEYIYNTALITRIISFWPTPLRYLPLVAQLDWWNKPWRGRVFAKPTDHKSWQSAWNQILCTIQTQ